MANVYSVVCLEFIVSPVFGRKEKLQLQGDPNAPVEIELNWADGKKLDRENEIVVDLDNLQEEE